MRVAVVPFTGEGHALSIPASSRSALFWVHELNIYFSRWNLRLKLAGRFGIHCLLMSTQHDCKGLANSFLALRVEGDKVSTSLLPAAQKHLSAKFCKHLRDWGQPSFEPK